MTWQETLSQNRYLWLSLIATILLTVAFQVAAGIWGLTLIDAISDPSETRVAISS